MVGLGVVADALFARPSALAEVALAWTVLELGAGVALLYGGLARARRSDPDAPRAVALAGISLALGLAVARLALHPDARALAWIALLVVIAPIRSAARSDRRARAPARWARGREAGGVGGRGPGSAAGGTGSGKG